MRIRDVDFPQQVLDAQQKGELVIFAGAGVSRPDPSNYPDFNRLAEEVASAVLVRENGEPVDRFLGKLAAQGVAVHERTRTILSRPDSAPNPLHTNLLRLFQTASKIRLVTTNFDVHFTSAARTAYPTTDIETYAAPALPLGGSDYGITYLHGSVARPSDRLILTDADFGRAYLTEGWATRFLQRLFEKRCVVLFVGYSHNDTVMNYLTRGLPPESEGARRFALTESGKDAHWRFLGITPIPYPLTQDENPHSLLGIAVNAWADLANTGALEQEQRIRDIAEAHFPPSGEDLDYVANGLKDISTARFFTRYARGPEWLRWIEGKDFMSALFRPTLSITDVDYQLANWFAENFITQHPGDALAVVQRQGQTLNPALWAGVAIRLFQWAKSGERAPATLSKWVCLLISSRPAPKWKHVLEYLLCELTIPDDENTAVLLFDFLTKPSILLEPDVWGKIQNDRDREDVDVELMTHGGGYMLEVAWRRLFQPSLQSCGDKLVWIITAHLQEANLLLRAAGKADENWDPLSYSRSRIEHPSGTSPEDGISVLTGAARDILKWNISCRPIAANFLIGAWLRSDSLLLRRLAIFGVAGHGGWTANEKIAWLLENDLLYSFRMTHDVLGVLESAYPEASQQSKEALLDRAAAGPSSIQDERSRDLAIYSLLHSIHTMAPECSLAKARLGEIAAKYPEIRMQEPPDLDAPADFGFVRPRSPLTVEEVLAKTPEGLIEFAVGFKPKDPLAPDLDGLVDNVGNAVASSYEWGMALADALAKAGPPTPNLWAALVSGWRLARLSGTQWTEVLKFINQHNQLLTSATHQIAGLLDEGMRPNPDPIPAGAMPIVMSLVKKLWPICTISDDQRKEVADDWYLSAISRSPGPLINLWIRIIDLARKELGDGWAGLPQEHKRFLETVLGEESQSGELGRVLLAHRVHFLFTVDRDWATQWILPLFDWSKGPGQALQAWHGYLSGGTWNDAVLTHLLPFYEQAFAVFSEEFGTFREPFCRCLAEIACFSSINPKQGWLNRFIARAKPEERLWWGSAVWQRFDQMDDPAKENAWNNWIKPYWQNRITGIPAIFDGREVTLMIDWSARLRPVFAEIVEEILKSPNPSSRELSGNFVYEDLSTSDLPERSAEPIATLLLHMLHNGLCTYYDFDQVEAITKRAAAAGAPRKTIADICNALADLGDPGAKLLRETIEGGTDRT
jgi:hypothetical protein